MQVLENISLRPYNTFHIDVTAKQFAAFSSAGELEELLAFMLHASHTPKLFILGGGSNVLFTQNFNGIVLKNELAGIEIVREDDLHYYVRANAGENWHRFVLHCIERNYAGLENLSLIPGCVGASPMQNIGAYGVEIKDVFESLQAYDLEDKKVAGFNLNDCEFGYRDSIFKQKYKGRFVVLNVVFRLNKKPVFNTSYGAVEQELQAMGVRELSIKAISQAVINIRSSKLPDPANIGNAGSFFKNPQITMLQFNTLKEKYPNIPGYPVNGHTIKVAAGWLIEQCGWKGYRNGDVGVHAKQALVLVNYGDAGGGEIYNLSAKIIESVQSTFAITLEKEVNIV
jgi:UDP-N-acetylmuramate dehydrogenase